MIKGYCKHYHSEAPKGHCELGKDDCEGCKDYNIIGGDKNE